MTWDQRRVLGRRPRWLCPKRASVLSEPVSLAKIRESGTSAQYTTRRLGKQRPELSR